MHVPKCPTERDGAYRFDNFRHCKLDAGHCVENMPSGMLFKAFDWKLTADKSGDDLKRSDGRSFNLLCWKFLPNSQTMSTQAASKCLQTACVVH